jgi:hypothetical protein
MSWPYPGDAPIAQARKVARAYRAAALGDDPPTEVARLDVLCLTAWGQPWVAPAPTTYGLDDMLTPREAADIAATSTANLRRLRKLGRLTGVQEESGRWLYRARDVLRVISVTRQRKTEA